MSLLLEIQQGAIDSVVDISTVLRKAQLLAARLKNKDFAEWVSWELNGYPQSADLPDYRFVGGRLMGSFALTFQRLATLPIPSSVLPDNLREKWAEGVRLRDSAATYAALLQRGSEIKNSNPVSHWPPDMARFYGSKAYEDAFCTDAWIEFDRSAFARLLDAIRSRLLGFAIAIEIENPEAGEANIRSTPVDPEKVTQVFNTTIYGGTNNVAAGGSRAVQNNSTNGILPGDFESLRRCLLSLGTESGEIDRLESTLNAATTVQEKKRAAGGWLVDHMVGAKDFASDVMGKAIAEFLKG